MTNQLVALSLTLLAATAAYADAPRDALRKWSRARAEGGSLGEPPTLPLEPARPLTGQRARGATVTIDRAALRFQGEPLDETALTARLRVGAEQARRFGVSGALILDVSGATPWSVVVHDLIVILRAGIHDVSFRFTGSPLPKPFPAGPIDANLAGAEPAMRATTLARMAASVFARCPAALRAFAATGSVAPDEKGAFLAEGIDEALGDAHCTVDPPTVQSYLDALFGDPVQTFTVHIDPTAPTRVVAPARATWHEVTSRGQLDAAFAHAGTRVAFSVR